MLKHKEARWRLAAATALLDRGYGRPSQEHAEAINSQSFTFLHLVAAQASGEQLRAALLQMRGGGAAPVLEHDDEDAGTIDGEPPDDIMAPALE
jgi:hypothetical protein